MTIASASVRDGKFRVVNKNGDVFVFFVAPSNKKVLTIHRSPEWSGGLGPKDWKTPMHEAHKAAVKLARSKGYQI